MIRLPQGFTSHVANVGIKDETTDLVIVAAERTVSAAGVFTKSRFAGPSVDISRRNLADRLARAVVVLSKNANVANGPQGRRDAQEVVELVAGVLGCEASDVLIASTGVIGRRYPMDRIRIGIAEVHEPLSGLDAIQIAKGIMTTDTVHKIAETEVGRARIVGVAKGVGMIEPDMATLIALVFTDAAVNGADLDAIWRRVIDRTFNCVSIDSDTSTSDTAIVLASGDAGTVDLAEFEVALESVCLSLTKQVARDGEGAEKLIEVTVDGSRDTQQAKTVAKSIVNSPLVKTAIHGADPNWGRVAMAIGKCSQYTDIDPEAVVIRFGLQEVYPRSVDERDLISLSDYMSGSEIAIHVSLGTGNSTATVWGCDLTDGYIRINADYTT